MRAPALALVLLAACGPDPSTPPPDGPPPPDLPDPVCRAGGTRWSPGATAFRDATADWGLDPSVVGLRLSLADIDNDGWVDVVSRTPSASESDFSDAGTDGKPPPRHHWVLRNTGRRSFEDVTEGSGLFQRRNPAGRRSRPAEVVVFGDVDNDGTLDAYTGYSSTYAPGNPETCEVMLNDGTGHFSFAPAHSAVRLPGEIQMPAGASFVDYDLDGFLDLFVSQVTYNRTSGGSVIGVPTLPERLLQGDGLGAFADAATDAGLVSRAWDVGRPSWAEADDLNAGRGQPRGWGAVACDLTNDGLPELMSSSYGRAPNHLWQAEWAADGGVRFANRSVESGYAYDERFEYHDNQYFLCWCEQNPQDADCRYCQSHPDAPDCAGPPVAQISCPADAAWNAFERQKYNLGGNSGTTVCADIDNDGFLDLFTTEIRHWWAGIGSDHSEVLVNSGEPLARLTRPGRESMGLVVPHDESDWDEGHMSAAVFDFDNDGWPDLYIAASDYPGTRGLLYHQSERLRFELVPSAQGVDHHRSHGVLVGDFDRDGDLDLVLGHSWARCGAVPGRVDQAACYPSQRLRLFENVTPPGNFLQLRLEGTGVTNRSAIGARVTVEAGDVSQTQEVGGGHGHYGTQQDLVLHFGLGAACEARVTVRWPDAAGSTDAWTLPAGWRFHLRQGDNPVVDPRGAP